MLLSDSDIHARGPELVQPFNPAMVQPASIDLRLDTHFLVATFDPWIKVDPSQENPAMFKDIDVDPGGVFTLGPKEFALASTYEKVTIPEDLAGRFEGKSSLGRIGLFTHITAGFIDPGFEGHITLELFNALPVPMELHPGMKIGQLCFLPMLSNPETPYGGPKTGSHYQGQRGPTPSRSYMGFHQTDVWRGDV